MSTFEEHFYSGVCSFAEELYLLCLWVENFKLPRKVTQIDLFSPQLAHIADALSTAVAFPLLQTVKTELVALTLGTDYSPSIQPQNANCFIATGAEFGILSGPVLTQLAFKVRGLLLIEATD